METKVKTGYRTFINVQIKTLVKYLDIKMPKGRAMDYNDIVEWLRNFEKINLYIKFDTTFKKWTYIVQKLNSNDNWLQGTEIYNKIYEDYDEALKQGIITVLDKILYDRTVEAISKI